MSSARKIRVVMDEFYTATPIASNGRLGRALPPADAVAGVAAQRATIVEIGRSNGRADAVDYGGFRVERGAKRFANSHACAQPPTVARMRRMRQAPYSRRSADHRRHLETCLSRLRAHAK